MKKYLGTIFFLLSQTLSVVAQNRTALPEDHFLELGRIENGDTIQVRRYLHFDLHQQAMSEDESKSSGEERDAFYKKAFASEPVPLPQGEYSTQNSRTAAQFQIAANGLVNGPFKFADLRRQATIKAVVKNGLVMQFVTYDRSGNARRKGTQKDSVFLVEEFEPSGRRVSSEAVYLIKGPDYRKTIRKHYHENGKLSMEQDDIRGTFVTYYENGKKERETDERSASGAEYDKSGRLQSRYFRKDGYRCSESYEEGVLNSRECESPKDRKTTYYTRGKLSRTEVYDFTTGKSTVYDAKGKVLDEPAVSDQVPMMSPGVDK